MKENIKEKLRESLFAVLPITLIVAFLSFSIAPVSVEVFVMFLVGACMLLLGIALFNLGAEISMTTIGDRIGAYISTRKRTWVSLLLLIFIGTIVIATEPDLGVLAGQVHEIPAALIIGVVAIGSGFLLAIGYLRMKKGIKLKYILMFLYAITFLLACFTPKEFWAIAFDSGGVATGAVSVPFIMALGAGAASLKKGKNTENDSFGLLAICSVGPVIALMIFGLFYNVTGVSYSNVSLPNIETSTDIWEQFTCHIPNYMVDVAQSLLPLLIIFFLFRIFAFKVNRNEMFKIVIGFFYAFVGLVFFSAGANVGFMPAGSYIAEVLADTGNSWMVIAVGMIFGYYIVKAEPAVGVLVRQISDITDGAISEKLMMFSQEVGLALAIGLAMIKIMTGISVLWILIPCYLLAFILSFITPEIFTSIAFDSGGVASGTMTAVFLVPFAIGICNAFSGNALLDAFGIVAIAAAVPVVCIQLVGILYKAKLKHRKEVIVSKGFEEIIEIDWMWANE